MKNFEEAFKNLALVLFLGVVVGAIVNGYLKNTTRYDVINESGEVIHSDCTVKILEKSGTLYVTNRMGEEFIYINNKWKLRKSLQ